ncbi:MULTISPECIES: type VI secretion system Vgr family protein [Cupriavidus]
MRQPLSHKGQCASEPRLDDTTKEIGATPMNDHGASALHPGYLIHSRPRTRRQRRSRRQR